MKITVKMSDTMVVICSKCNWSGAIEDAHWMQETEYGNCPSCGSSEFNDIEAWEKVEEYSFGGGPTDDPGIDSFTWEWTGWKARIAVYALMVVLAIFIGFPLVWGYIDILKRIFF